MVMEDKFRDSITITRKKCNMHTIFVFIYILDYNYLLTISDPTKKIIGVKIS